MDGTPVTVSATATLIAEVAGIAGTPATVMLLVPSGGAQVYLGGPAVSGAGNGFALPVGTPVAIDRVNENLFACTTTGTQSIQRLRTKA